jgi:hypothetical protein
MDAHCRADALPHAPFADTRRAYSDRSPPPRHRPYGRQHGFDRASQNVHCACTHYLVFKEPAVPDARSARPAALPPTTIGRLQANLPRLREGSQSVNPSSSRVRGFEQREKRIGGASVFWGQKNLLSDFSRSKLSAAYLLGPSAASCLAANLEPAGHAQTGANYTRRSRRSSSSATNSLQLSAPGVQTGLPRVAPVVCPACDAPPRLRAPRDRPLIS